MPPWWKRASGVGMVCRKRTTVNNRDMMITSVRTYLGKQNRGSITTRGIALVIGLGAIGFVSGYEVSFSIFYLVPIALVTWFAGRRYGSAVAMMSAIVWLKEFQALRQNQR
jgi:hypothetical protein